MYGTYQNWGFRSSPFDPGPLPPTEAGAKLLIGRTAEVEKITRRLLTRGKIVTVEGSNGIGKTSINNVASYLAYSSYLNRELDQMLVPCEKTFQLTKDSDIDTFVDSVYLQLGITLLRYAEKLKESGRGTSLEGPIGAWLTSPTISSVRANLSVQGVGGIYSGPRF